MKKTLIRALVSIILLWLLISRIDLRNIKDIICNFNPFYYLFAFFVLFVHQYIWATTWRVALSEKNIVIRPKDIYRAVLTSYFFGTFLPSSLGPDIILTFNIGKSLSEKQHAPSSLLFIRIMNITSILLVSGIVLIFISHTSVLRQIARLTWLILLIVWISYWLATHRKSRMFVERITKRYRFLGFIYKIFHSFSTFGLDNKITLRIWLLGLAMAFLKVLIDYLVALSLGIHIPYIWFLGLVPSISIISLLPISIAGLGVREGAYMGIFSIMGIQPANSFSISLAVFTLNIWLCIIGGILYLRHGVKIKSS